MKGHPSRHMVIVVFISMGALFLLSAVPWGRITGNRIKDFNLIEDLVPRPKPAVVAEAQPEAPAIDPELENFMAENAKPVEELPAEPVPEAVVEVDTSVVEHVPAVVEEVATVDSAGMVLIESYGEAMLPRFKAALSRGKARVAVLGDSFIEGDIFTQDLRAMLQERYGGEGVGYVGMHSDFPGFRQTVRLGGRGWKMRDIRNFSGRDTVRTVSGEYGLASAGAKATYKGSKSRKALGSWSRSRFLFVSPDSGTVTLATDAGPRSFAVAPSGEVQMLELEGATGEFVVESDIPGMVGLGVYLDAAGGGVQVDCMSIRGNSGIGHRKMNMRLAAGMRRWVDYDLIVLEYGMNALSPEQYNYEPYAVAMAKVVERIRSCYPDADIIVLGVSDRGVKNGADVRSLHTCEAMVKAQRSAARRTGVHFWDTRMAMGGDNAVVDWRRRKLVNADYIHLNYAGGRELATLFYQSLNASLGE